MRRPNDELTAPIQFDAEQWRTLTETVREGVHQFNQRLPMVARDLSFKFIWGIHKAHPTQGSIRALEIWQSNETMTDTWVWETAWAAVAHRA